MIIDCNVFMLFFFVNAFLMFINYYYEPHIFLYFSFVKCTMNFKLDLLLARAIEMFKSFVLFEPRFMTRSEFSSWCQLNWRNRSPLHGRNDGCDGECQQNGVISVGNGVLRKQMSSGVSVRNRLKCVS